MQGALDKRPRAPEVDRPRAQGAESEVAVNASELAKPDLLPDDVAAFDQKEVRSKQGVTAIEKTRRLGRQYFGREPLYRDAGIDDEVDRSRSSRRSSALSDCGVAW